MAAGRPPVVRFRAGAFCAATLLVLFMVVGSPAIRFATGTVGSPAMLAAGDDDEE